MNDKATIFIADDATFIRDLIKKTLRTEYPNSEIHEVADGKKAMTNLKKLKQVDLILCDWEMPEFSGEEVLQWVRNESDLKDTQFIMVTSRGDKSHIVAAAQAGVSDYLVKPFKGDQLIQKIDKALKKCGRLSVAKKRGGAASSSQGFAAESASILSGNSAEIKPSDSPTTSKESPASKTAPPTKLKQMAKAIFRIEGVANDCLLESLSQQKALILIRRDDDNPLKLFSQAVIDFALPNDSNAVARINTYIYKLERAEDNFDSRFIRAGLQIVDEDNDKAAFIQNFLSQST